MAARKMGKHGGLPLKFVTTLASIQMINDNGLGFFRDPAGNLSVGAVREPPLQSAPFFQQVCINGDAPGGEMGEDKPEK